MLNDFVDNVDRSFKKTYKKVISRGDYSCYLFTPVKTNVVQSLGKYCKVNPDEPFTGLPYNIADVIVNGNQNTSFRNVSHSLVNQLKDKKSFLLYKAISLQSYYHSSAAIPEVASAIENAASRITEAVCSSLSLIFDDVYCDIFSFVLSGEHYSMESYIDGILYDAGPLLYNTYTDERTIARLLAVSSVLYSGELDDGSILNHLISKISVSNPEKASFRNNFEYFRQSPFIEPIIQYAELCKKSLTQQYNSESDSDSLQALRRLTSEDSSEQLDGMFHFWSYVSKRYIKEGSSC